MITLTLAHIILLPRRHQPWAGSPSLALANAHSVQDEYVLRMVSPTLQLDEFPSAQGFVCASDVDMTCFGNSQPSADDVELFMGLPLAHVSHPFDTTFLDVGAGQSSAAPAQSMRDDDDNVHNHVLLETFR